MEAHSNIAPTRGKVTICYVLLFGNNWAQKLGVPLFYVKELLYGGIMIIVTLLLLLWLDNGSKAQQEKVLWEDI